MGFCSDRSQVYLHKSTEPENLVIVPDQERQLVRDFDRPTMALKTQLGMTFTNGKLSDIQFCNVDGCFAKFDQSDLEIFNFSINQYNEQMKFRTIGKNYDNSGTFKIYDIAVYNREKCQGWLNSQFFISLHFRFVHEFLVENFCENGCPKHSTCAGYNQCECNEGWAGSNCDIGLFLHSSIVTVIFLNYSCL